MAGAAVLTDGIVRRRERIGALRSRSRRNPCVGSQLRGQRLEFIHVVFGALSLPGGNKSGKVTMSSAILLSAAAAAAASKGVRPLTIEKTTFDATPFSFMSCRRAATGSSALNAAPVRAATETASKA